MSTELLLFAEDPAVAPDVLEYHEHFLTAPEERDLLAQIDTSEWLTDLSRRVLHFGFKYDYSNRRLDETARIGPLPEWLTCLAFKVREAASADVKPLIDQRQPFEQAIINEYEPGQGIAPHIDRDCFGPVVATVSLASGINMDFIGRATGENHVERLEPRSLLLLHGDARVAWRHGIAKRRKDKWHGQTLERRRRVSITFRTISDQSPS